MFLRVPKSPECYAKVHGERIKDFPEETDGIKYPHKLKNLKNQPQDDERRHELDHDVESVPQIPIKGGAKTRCFGSSFTGIWSRNLRNVKKNISIHLPGRAC
jgi:hypothetical protein